MSRYAEVCSNFTWEQAWESFDGTPDAFNMGHEMIGKQADLTDTAIRIVDFETDEIEEIAFDELYARAAQFANYLDELGLSVGDYVAGMLEPCPELFATIAGSWLGGYVYVPLYTLFGPDALNYRLADSGARMIVTSSDHAEKVDDNVDSLDHVVLVDGASEDGLSANACTGGGTPGGAGDRTSFDVIDGHATTYEHAPTTGDDLLAIQYTSGTTGPPKGVEIPHRALVTYYPYATYGLDLTSEDVFCATAPPAWTYGLCFSTPYPLHLGTSTTMFRGRFDVETFFDTVERYNVTNLFATPTVFRQAAGLDVDWEDREFALRIVSSGGETVGSDTVAWSERVLGCEILETYGFTEGGMVAGNFHFDDWETKPGSLGQAMPGYHIEVLDEEEDAPVDSGETGEIAIHREWGPLLATGYLNMPEKTEEKFGGEWMRSEDLARVDDSGYIWFEGRKDNVILSSGYRIGPTEVEESVMKHEAVAETAVIGLPDEERTEIVTAVVVLADGYDPSPDLADKIRAMVKRRLSKHEYPRRIEFVTELPKTVSGKIKRYELEETFAGSS